MPLPILVINI